MSEFRIQVIVDPSGAKTGGDAAVAQLERINSVAEKTKSLLGTVFAGFAIEETLRELGELSDTFTGLQNRLRVVTGSQAELRDVTHQLFQVANETRSSFESTTELYARMSLATSQLGIDQSKLLDFTQAVNEAIILSGASAKEAASGLIQLSQGIASNRLANEELRSILKELPVVADVIAKQLGITRGELKAFGAEGKITGQVIFDAFINAKSSLDTRFEKTISTISQAFVQLRNSVVLLVGEFSNSSGIAQVLSGAIKLLADNLNLVARSAVILGAAFAGFKLSQLVTQIQAAQAAQASFNATIAAGDAVLLGSAEASLQKAAFEQAIADATVNETRATIEAIAAEQAYAVVKIEATEAGRAQTESLVTLAAARARAAESALADAEATAAERLATSQALAQESAEAETILELANARVKAAAGQVVASEAAASSVLRFATEADGLAASEALLEESIVATAAAERNLIAVELELTGAELESIAATDARTAARQLALETSIADEAQSIDLAAALDDVAAAEAASAQAAAELAAANAALSASVEEVNLASAERAAIDAQVLALESQLFDENLALAASTEAVGTASAAAAAESSFLARSLAGVSAGVDSITAAIAANPIGIFLTILAAGAAALVVFRDDILLTSDGVGTFGDFLRALGETIKETFGEIAGFFSDIFASKKPEDDLNKVHDGVTNFLLFLGKAFDLAAAPITALFTASVTLFRGIGPAIGDTVISTLNFVIAAFSAFFKTIADETGRFVQGLADAFNGLGSAISLSLKGDFSGAADAATKAVKDAVAGIADATLGAPEQFVANLTSATNIDAITNPFKGAAADLGSEVGQAFIVGLTDTSVEDKIRALLARAEEIGQARNAKGTPTKTDAVETRNPNFEKIVEELKERAQVLSVIGLTNQQREVENNLLKIRKELLDKGTPATDAQIEFLRAILQTNQGMQDQIDVANGLHSLQETAIRDTEAATAAYFNLRISAEDYAKKLTQIKIASETPFQKTIEGLQEQNSILKLVGTSTADLAEKTATLAAVEALRRQGENVTADDKAKIAGIIAENQALDRRNQLVAANIPISAQLAQETKDADRAFADGAISADQYARILRDISVQAADAGRSLQDGFTSGFAAIEDKVTNLADVTKTALTDAFTSTEDALVNFVKTGKFSFADFAESIILDITKIVARMLLLQALQSLFPGFGALAGGAAGGGANGFQNIIGGSDFSLTPFGGAGADGINTDPNSAYLVGERGPELFKPNAFGTVVPHAQTIAGLASRQSQQVVVQSPPVNITIHNNVDSGQLVAAGLKTPTGNREFVNRIGANRNSTKATINS